jgi:NAD(P)H dehydrogenase (quinone)
VSLVAYTSTLKADTAATIIGATHRATEEYLRGRRVSTALLRNG